MASKFGQTAVQVQTQQQTLSPQQVMTARLTELPLDGLRERINKELEDNQWLETKGERDFPADSVADTSGAANDFSSEDNFDDNDDALPRAMSGGGEAKSRELGDYIESFFDHLTEQLGEYELTEHEKEVLHYLIGSLEEDGMLRTPLSQIADELDIYQNVQTDEKELEHLLTTVLQQMEPAGVGGRNLQECLVLQARRNYQGKNREQLLTLFTRHWDDFSHTRWRKIQTSMKMDDTELESLMRRVRHLTPRPGGSIGNDNHADTRSVTPDFYVTTTDDGSLRLSLNEGDLPRLTISSDADVALAMPVVTKEDREAVRYLRDQVASAQLFIDAIAQRRRSMLLTMKAIIKLQRPFFLTGDEMSLKPMKLEDVSNLTGLDISTTSRVSNSKYVQTSHGVYPLRWFFTSAAIKDGDEVSVRNILSALKDLVDTEDKAHPLSDEKLVAMLRERGYAVARRTVAKYRTQLGIPESRLR